MSSRIGGMMFLVLGLTYGWFIADIPLDFFSEQEPFNARSMPWGIAAATVVVALLLIVFPAKQEAGIPWKALNWKPALLLVLAMSGYGLTLEYLGFIGATALFLVVGILILGERRYWQIGCIAISVAVGFYFLMKGLGIYLEPGELWSALGNHAHA
ncbi:MAG: tripartite tricarboxylate transporter TctB family protein [Pseudomonadales bacterium]|nr:tripartite tricarboxylate transporter TctB family protein [Pseudomonadales bacterium]